MFNLVHVINPVKVPSSSDLFVAQPVTFETIRRAKEFSQERLGITLLSVGYEEDLDVVTEDFIKTPNILRSFRDVVNMNEAKKLPIIRDILQAAYDHSEPDSYLIYSNVDIAVQPYFYDFLAFTIRKGYDAFVINRRTISKDHTKIEEISKMYSEIGTAHPGYDCFIFHKELFPNMVLNDLCIGAAGIGLGLFINLYMLSNKFEIFNKEHLTFHIGDDKNWKDQTMEKNHNSNELGKIIFNFRGKKKLEEAFDFHESKLGENGFPFTFNWRKYLNE